MRFLGVNAAGLRPKILTFKKILNELKPSVFFIEETKYKDEGKLKIENYVIFELVRKSRDGGGGLALGCLKELNPVWVGDGGNEVEALSIVISVREMNIRCCVAYGCQENSKMENKRKFWEYLYAEVKKAKSSGSGLVIHFDGNLWAGSKIIPGDPRPQNNNGKLFEQFLQQNPHLTVVNSLPLCEGIITRRRQKNGILEESVLDFFIICDKVLPYVTKMEIDEDKKYILTNYEQVRKGGKASDTDHATQIMDVSLKIINEKPKRREMFNFQNKEGQQVFKNETTFTNDFTDCFKSELPLIEQIRYWRQKLNEYFGRAFKKIRIKPRTKIKSLSKELTELITLRNKLVIKNGPQEKVNVINKTIADLEAVENRNIIIRNFKTLSEDPEKVDQNKMWKTMRKIWPKFGSNLPTAKKNHNGKIVTDPQALKMLLAKEYTERLRTRPIRNDFSENEKYKNMIFDIKMKIASLTKSPDWSILDLEQALKDLKTKKSRDFEGLLNEIFKQEVIGEDLKNSLLIMFNKIKKEQKIPEFFNFANITTIPKKGSKLELKNERGIFRVSVIRSILMRLIYNSKYPAIDENISDCQMGGRRNKNSKYNIFIVNGIIHEVLKNRNSKPVLLQIYDYAQMFDAINLKKAISDIYDAGLKDDNLILIQKANEQISMAVNTPAGLSERQKIDNCVLQGDTWGSLLASVQVDTIGQECEDSGLGYRYKDQIQVTMLGMVDDMLGITEAGYRAHQLNAIINTLSAEKGLQFGVSKCKTMLIGNNFELEEKNKLSVDKWSVSHKNEHFSESFDGKVFIEQTNEQKYLGFVLSSTGNNMANINQMKRKSIGIIRSIFSKLESLNLKQYFFECALVLMNAILRSSIFYASETYYNLKEKEIRHLERIEESFLRQLLKTGKGCPISQLYLELGQVPGRFEIIKIRLLFLKNILDEDEDTRVYKFFNVQKNNPSRGDWVSTCRKNLEEIKLGLTMNEIKETTKAHFSKLLKQKIREAAFKYLVKKQGKKGGDIKYSGLQMANYLQPYISNLSITEKQEIFSLRNSMVNIPTNFGIEENCQCGKLESTKHIYECKIFNEEEAKEKYEEIYSEKIGQIRNIYMRYKENMKNREKLKMETSHVTNGPLFSVHCIDNSNG